MVVADGQDHRHDPGASGRPKKSLSAALHGLAKAGQTAHPELARILLARKVNIALGGAVVGPWDIDRLDDVTLDAIAAMVDDLPGMQKSLRLIDDAFSKMRQEHPTYRK